MTAPLHDVAICAGDTVRLVLPDPSRAESGTPLVEGRVMHIRNGMYYVETFIGEAETISVPRRWLELITDPCPWTEYGTVVMSGTHPSALWTLTPRGWQSIGTDLVVDWPTLAKSNPVRMVPERAS